MCPLVNQYLVALKCKMTIMPHLSSILELLARLVSIVNQLCSGGENILSEIILDKGTA